jgi:hypothetical protein
MNRSYRVEKKIIKEITILKYLPDLQTYQLAIKWDSRSEPTVFHMSEMLFYPYSIE